MKRTLAALLALLVLAPALQAEDEAAPGIVHDAEYYVLEAQNGTRWAGEDKGLEARMAALREKHGRPPNIIYVLWDDMSFGAVGFPALQKNFGYETPNINKLAEDGINFTRMYTEPTCTPTRVAFLTGRHTVRSGMGIVGMPHEMAGLPASEVTIAEVLSEAGYATAHFGKGHLGDIEESYLHNQGFDEALFTSMNQLISQWNATGDAVGAARGFLPENAGGVTVSYFEWAQSIQQFSWELDRVVDELEKTMRKAYGAVRDVAQAKRVDLRTGAFVLAIQRVGKAALSRRSVREEIDLS